MEKRNAELLTRFVLKAAITITFFFAGRAIVMDVRNKANAQCVCEAKSHDN